MRFGLARRLGVFLFFALTGYLLFMPFARQAYLWHVPVIKLLARHADAGPIGLLALGVAVCVPIALVSYAIVERPFLRLRGRWGSTFARQAPAVVTAPRSPALSGRRQEG